MRERGKMKEHTIFATVFLLLVVGFVSFSNGGVTGNVFEEYNWRGPDSPSQYQGEVTTGPSSARDLLRKDRLVGTIGPTTYTSTYGRIGEAALSYLPAPVGSDTRNWLIYSDVVDVDFGVWDMRTYANCILQILLRGSINQADYAQGEYYLNTRKMRGMCPPPTDEKGGLDVNKDGFISMHDLNALKSFQRGRDTVGVWSTLSGQMICSEIGQQKVVNGVIYNCVEKQRMPVYPTPYWKGGVLVRA